MVFRLANKILNNAPLAQDITQEVFCELYTQKPKGIKSIASWLYRVAANNCYDQLKSSSKLQDSIHVEIPDTKSEDQNVLEKQNMVHLAVSKLNDKDRILVVLYSENRSYKEIAEITGMNFSSVGKTLARALKKLEKELKPNYYELFV